MIMIINIKKIQPGYAHDYIHEYGNNLKNYEV